MLKSYKWMDGMGMEIAVAPLLKAPLCGANNKGFNSKLPFTFYKTLSLLLLFVWSGYMSVKWTAPLAPFLSHTGADRVLISYILRRGKKKRMVLPEQKYQYLEN